MLFFEMSLHQNFKNVFAQNRHFWFTNYSKCLPLSCADDVVILSESKREENEVDAEEQD